MERDQARADVRVRPGVVDGQPPGNGLHLRPRCRQGNVRSDARDDVPPAAAAQAGLVLRDRLGHVDVALAAAAFQTELEVRPEHADHVVRLPVQRQRPPEDSGVTAEAAFPESVCQNDDATAREELLRKERPAVGGAGAERLEEPFRDERRVEHLGLALVSEVEGVRLDRRHLLETRRLFAPVQEVRRRRLRGAVAVVRIGLPQRHEAVRLRERRRLEQHRVHDREDGRGSPDRQRQRQNRRRRETGLPAKEPETEPGVLDDLPQSCAGAEHPIGGVQLAVLRPRRSGHRVFLSVTVTWSLAHLVSVSKGTVRGRAAAPGDGAGRPHARPAARDLFAMPSGLPVMVRITPVSCKSTDAPPSREGLRALRRGWQVARRIAWREQAAWRR